LSTIESGVVAVGAKARITLFNRTAERLIGMAANLGKRPAGGGSPAGPRQVPREERLPMASLAPRSSSRCQMRPASSSPSCARPRPWSLRPASLSARWPPSTTSRT
jgi:hypothetical protein